MILGFGGIGFLPPIMNPYEKFLKKWNINIEKVAHCIKSNMNDKKTAFRMIFMGFFILGGYFGTVLTQVKFRK